jgi:hypothetical protein
MGKSHQRGWVVPRGKKWYGYFRKSILDSTTNQQKSDVVSVILGLESQMKASEAREALECEITKRTGQRGPSGGRAMNDSSATFGWFVRKRFFPLKEANWKEETAKVKKFIIQRDLNPEGSDRPVRADSVLLPNATKLEKEGTASS